MGKADFLSPKAISNRIKSKGLQKLRWYCQMCQKQCRDENGFKCHCMSESHQRQLLLASENPNRFMDHFSQEFKKDFLELLRRRFGTKRVHNNIIYNEYISDRQHIHMNATRWETLTDFTKWLGREGLCKVDETPKGWYIQYIDRDPETIRRQEELARKNEARPGRRGEERQVHRGAGPARARRQRDGRDAALHGTETGERGFFSGVQPRSLFVCSRTLKSQSCCGRWRPEEGSSGGVRQEERRQFGVQDGEEEEVGSGGDYRDGGEEEEAAAAAQDGLLAAAQHRGQGHHQEVRRALPQEERRRHGGEGQVFGGGEDDRLWRQAEAGPDSPGDGHPCPRWQTGADPERSPQGRRSSAGGNRGEELQRHAAAGLWSAEGETRGRGLRGLLQAGV
uniref:Kin17 DNA and RNA binding protein n=1 Tax=Tetraodon nigroviridis TaxID=99883 RepID=H3D522_TETNG